MCGIRSSRAVPDEVGRPMDGWERTRVTGRPVVPGPCRRATRACRCPSCRTCLPSALPFVATGAQPRPLSLRSAHRTLRSVTGHGKYTGLRLRTARTWLERSVLRRGLRDRRHWARAPARPAVIRSLGRVAQAWLEGRSKPRWRKGPEVITGVFNTRSAPDRGLHRPGERFRSRDEPGRSEQGTDQVTGRTWSWEGSGHSRARSPEDSGQGTGPVARWSSGGLRWSPRPAGHRGGARCPAAAGTGS